MAWWKKNKSSEPLKINIPVVTIPEDFYAGRTPEITFQTSRAKVKPRGQSSLTASEKKALDRATATGSGSAAHPATALSSRKTFIWLLLGVFVVGIAGASVYYFVLSKKNAPQTVTPTAPTPVPTTPTEPVVTEPEPVVAPPTTTEPVAINPADLPFSTISISTPDASDSDSDGLSALEEELYKTDPNLADSDLDKYTDSHEVYNLYNPAGKEPQKLSDSGLVKDFTNPSFGYSMYHPDSWAVGNVDGDYRDVLFSTFTGEYVRVHVYDKEPSESFANFMTRLLPDEKIGDYSAFDSRFKESGYRRSDFMVFVWLKGNTAVVMAYNLSPTSLIANYRTVIKMMARSIRLGTNTVEIPVQVVESATSTPSSVINNSTTTTTSTAL